MIFILIKTLKNLKYRIFMNTINKKCTSPLLLVFGSLKTDSTNSEVIIQIKTSSFS